ncbi:hypothetical protein CDL12_04609 [Handroanthus impetiginosus]|uniref:Uncharacterized protein n=1 Tax=Handroanthus impetiginosus TaxID=429701 RepID=A0A2G9HYS3_9LAMI|nr:hypothetical protein CDL12_04609 [Handroanthus impetiginosus]
MANANVINIKASRDETVVFLVSSIDHKLNGLSADTSFSYPSSIYRVPEQRRKANEAAYTPRLVSIGPLHRERGELQGMESYKLRCLRNFLTRSGVGLDDLVMFVADWETYVQGCYQDTSNLNSEQFLEMTLLDGIFIVELFLKNHFPQLREGSDVIFRNRWMWSDLLHDMLLLENQLPINVIKGLLNFMDHSFLIGITLLDLAHEFFKDVGNTEKLPLTEHCYCARHFVEFLLFLHSPVDPREPPSFPAMKFEYTRSATELQQAGVKFRCAEGSSLFDVVFIEGELTLPSLIVNDWTETFFRNLIASEQCGYYAKDVTSYVILMDSLINTPEDVALLVKHGIIKNALGENEAVADLFNNLYKEVVTDEFYFAQLCGDLNKYSKDPFHEFKSKWFRWRRMLRRAYFSNPWSLISLFAAVVLLILTVIQTVCSILQVK